MRPCWLTPDVSFNELVIMRAAQAAGLAFLFAPLSAIAFVNISPEDNGDASALLTMFRNVSGSIGISLTTALAFSRTQVRMGHLVPHLTPLDQSYTTTLQQYEQALIAQGGHAASTVAQTAMGLIYKSFQMRAAILAYTDVFAIGCIVAFCVVPVAFS